MKTTYCLERHESVSLNELAAELSHLQQSAAILFHTYKNCRLAGVPPTLTVQEERERFLH